LGTPQTVAKVGAAAGQERLASLSRATDSLKKKGPFKGPLKDPGVLLKGSRGPLKGPRGPFKGPRGPLKGSRGPLKGPGVLLKDPGDL